MATNRVEELTNNLKLSAFYDAVIEQESQPTYNDLPFIKRVQMLLEAEEMARDDKRLQRLLKQAKLHNKGCYYRNQLWT